MSEKTIDKYTTLQIQDRGEYGFSLIEGWINQNGDFKPNFCKREFRKGSGEKTAPLSIKLGDRAKALEVAEWLRVEMGGAGAADDRATGEDVPF